ncbi:MAG: ACP S-malonyltransferase [Clostridia bacterium]|nr:ACP S-malonyltransferase [Clostridia bacterium]
MKIGFIFPGQGSQYVGMGKDLYEKYDEVKKVYEDASKVLGIDVKQLSFEANEETLGQTKNTQITILTMSLGILELLKKEGIDAGVVSGLSLGEYTALIYAGYISFEDGMKIVRKRGELMQENIPTGEWQMASIIGLEDEAVEQICKEVNTGFVVPANYNCPGQVAISGEKQAVEVAMEKAKEAGARKVVPLKTSGPFHTEKLKVASDKLREELDKIEIKYNDKVKVIKNIDAKPYTEADDIIEILSKHVMSPVQYKKTLEEMLQEGVDTFIEIGPGKVLSGFVKRVNKEVKILNITDCDTLENVISTLKEEM